MDPVVQTAVISALGGIVALLANAIVAWLSDRRKRKYSKEDTEEQEEDVIKLAIACLLRRYLIDDHDYYMDKQYITVHGLENWEKMYYSYKALGGNGMVDALNKEIRELKVKSDDEESK